jgi:hypothetical protein
MITTAAFRLREEPERSGIGYTGHKCPTRRGGLAWSYFAGGAAQLGRSRLRRRWAVAVVVAAGMLSPARRLQPPSPLASPHSRSLGALGLLRLGSNESGQRP